MTITAAMTAKQRDEQDQETKVDSGALWSAMNMYGCNYWFLGVDQATEVTESFREQDRCNEGQNFAAQVKVRPFKNSQSDFGGDPDDCLDQGFFLIDPLREHVRLQTAPTLTLISSSTLIPSEL